MRKQDKKRIKHIHETQKVAKTYKMVLALMTPTFDKTRSEVALEVVQQLSNRHLKRIVSFPKRFDYLSPTGDLARLAQDDLILRALNITKL